MKHLKISSSLRAFVVGKFADGMGNAQIEVLVNTLAESNIERHGDFNAIYSNRSKTITITAISVLRSQWTRANQIHPNDVIALHTIAAVRAHP